MRVPMSEYDVGRLDCVLDYLNANPGTFVSSVPSALTYSRCYLVAHCHDHDQRTTVDGRDVVADSADREDDVKCISTRCDGRLHECR